MIELPLIVKTKLDIVLGSNVSTLEEAQEAIFDKLAEYGWDNVGIYDLVTLLELVIPLNENINRKDIITPEFEQAVKDTEGLVVEEKKPTRGKPKSAYFIQAKTKKKDKDIFKSTIKMLKQLDKDMKHSWNNSGISFYDPEHKYKYFVLDKVYPYEDTYEGCLFMRFPDDETFDSFITDNNLDYLHKDRNLTFNKMRNAHSIRPLMIEELNEIIRIVIEDNKWSYQIG